MVDIKLVSLPGDGIGTEVVDATIGVLREAGERWGARFIVEAVEAGAARYARTGVVYSEADFELCRAADAILLGALGLPDVVHRDGTEAGADLQFRLRFDLDLYAGVRPIRRYAAAPGPLATPEPLQLHDHSREHRGLVRLARRRRHRRRQGLHRHADHHGRRVGSDHSLRLRVCARQRAALRPTDRHLR